MKGKSTAKQFEFEGVKKDGSLIWLEIQNRTVPWEEKQAVQSTVIDITERSQAEHALKKAMECAEAATKLKDRFVTRVAHDLRSPFAAMIGYIRLMQDDTDHPLDSHQLGLLDNMLARGENLLKMIDELLNISRQQTGKIVADFQFVDAKPVVSLARGYVHQIADAKNITITNDVPEAPRIYTDIGLLCEVSQNLMTNATKICEAGDNIRYFVQDGLSRVLAVQDSGTGTGTAILPDIFRHEIKTTTVGTSGEVDTGLGLPFCGDTMSALRSSIRVETEEGEGTTFFIQFPDVRPQVLIAGKAEPDRHDLKDRLNQMGRDVIEVHDENSAVEAIDAHVPHLVIADMAQPDKDCFELLQSMKGIPKNKIHPSAGHENGCESKNPGEGNRIGS